MEKSIINLLYSFGHKKMSLKLLERNISYRYVCILLLIQYKDVLDVIHSIVYDADAMVHDSVYLDSINLFFFYLADVFHAYVTKS